MQTSDQIELLKRAYRLFNRRDIDGLFDMMTDDVEWPDVANGAVLNGKPAIRAYWEGQFSRTDPRVTPTDFVTVGADVVAIVDQRILDLQGEPVMPPAVVFHRYTFAGRRVRRMIVFTDRDQAMR